VSRFLNLRRSSLIVSNIQMEGGLFVNVDLMTVKKEGDVVGQTD